MYSSHSGTPILSALAVVAVVDAGVVVLVAAVLALLLVLVSVLAQPNRKMAHTTHKNNESLVNILMLLRLQPVIAAEFVAGMVERGNNTREMGIEQLCFLTIDGISNQ
jgi:hypothetical protein